MLRDLVIFKKNVRVNKGVEDDKDPDGKGIGSQTCPHAQNGTRVVIALQQTCVLSLEQDDDGVNDFVVLGEVKEVGPVMKVFVPQFLLSVAPLTH